MIDTTAAYEKAASALLCDCGCPPQSIKACACGRAEELRRSITADARSGKSGDQIIAAYVARDGPKVLVTPPASGFNLVAWTGPAIGLLGATILISLTIRRWRRASAALPADSVPAESAGDDAYRARLRRELEELR